MSSIQFPSLPQIYRFCTPTSADSLPFKVIKCAAALIALVGALWTIKSLLSKRPTFQAPNLPAREPELSHKPLDLSIIDRLGLSDLDTPTTIDPSTIESFTVDETVKTESEQRFKETVVGKFFTLRQATANIITKINKCLEIRLNEPHSFNQYVYWVPIQSLHHIDHGNLFLYKNCLKTSENKSWLEHIIEALVQKQYIKLHSPILESRFTVEI